MKGNERKRKKGRKKERKKGRKEEREREKKGLSNVVAPSREYSRA